jgi:beta-galactosidase/beta-glucuronidase
VWWGLGSQDSRLPAEFEITKFCHHVGKENVIAVQVMRWSDGSYLEDQDHWWLSGIHRNVIIFSKPQVMIADYFVTTEVEADFTSASLKVCWKHRYFFVTGGQSPQKFILKREREITTFPVLVGM